MGIWAPNRHEWVVTQYATARIGAILVTINPAYRASELDYALRQSGVRLLISATDFRTSDYRAMVSEVWSGLPALERVVYIGTPGWDELVESGESVPVAALRTRMAGLSCEDPINIQYTSGTTGFPKGATLSHRNILNNGYLSGGVLGYTEADRVCVPLPLDHCFGMVLAASARSPAAPAWSSPRPRSIRARRSPPSPRSAARRSTACRRCSSPSCSTPASPRSTSARSARA